jgi:hypothetical protein
VDQKRVFCLLCTGEKKEAGLSYCGSTTSLYNHLNNHHPSEWSQAEEEVKKRNEANEGGKPNIKNFFGAKVFQWSKSSPKWKETTKMIAKWFVKDTRPAQMVEDEGFRRLIAMVRPEYIVPCANTITSYIEELYIETTKQIKKELEDIEHVAVTTDGGSSSNCSSFQEVGLHGLTKNFELKYYTVAVTEVKEEHTAKNYRKVTDQVVEEFGVKEKVVMTTTDNENKMLAAFKDHERTGCVAHMMHSSVTLGLTKVPEVNDSIKKHRKIVTKHNKSFKVKYGLQEAQKRLKIKKRPLLQDVPTRWGSTRASTGSFLDHEDDKVEVVDVGSAVFGEELAGFANAQAINDALRKHKFKKKKEKLKDYLLTDTDMKRIKNVNAFLTKFDIYSTTLGANKFVTSSIVVPVVKSLQQHLEPTDDDPTYIVNMKAIILADFRARVAKYLNLPILFKATALDPRFKKLKVVNNKQGREDVFDLLLAEARKHLDNNNEVQAAEEEEQQLMKKRRKYGLDFPESDSDDEEEDALQREWDNYKAVPEVSRDEDVLGWWRANKGLYPNLAWLAR